MRGVNGDGGAVAIVVALLAVVLFGFGAFAIDISSLWSERRQLQSGADAAALAIAQQCAAGDCNAGVGGYQALASEYADANALDASANVGQGDGVQDPDFICGDGPNLPICLSPPFPPADMPGLGWVRVRTRTGNDVGPSVVPGVLAGALVPGYDGKTVQAYAIANWGAPASVSGGLALTFSACEWLKATGVTDLTSDSQAAATYAAPPPYPPTSPDTSVPPRYSADGWPIDAGGLSMERTIYLHDTAGAGNCDAGPAGSDLPGGFGWLSDPTTNGQSQTCYATTDDDGLLDVDTGNDVSNACKTALDSIIDAGQPISIPVFLYTNGENGANGAYTVAGFASFYMTGYFLGGSTKTVSAVQQDYPCGGQARCISGFFLDRLTQDADSGVVSSGPSLGATIVGIYE